VNYWGSRPEPMDHEPQHHPYLQGVGFVSVLSHSRQQSVIILAQLAAT
jgi:hypothetical protein